MPGKSRTKHRSAPLLRGPHVAKDKPQQETEPALLGEGAKPFTTFVPVCGIGERPAGHDRVFIQGEPPQTRPGTLGYDM